nr:branched-chain amino acid transport system II carrier protein [Bifidobacterium bifidum]
LIVVFAVAFVNPFANPFHTQATTAYVHGSFVNGFLQGYNTMDCLASLAFGITVITAIKGLGIKRQRDISWSTAKGGALGIIGIALIYIALIW